MCRRCFETKEEYNQYIRSWRIANRKKIREYIKKYNKKWREENGYSIEREWKVRNPEKVRAQGKLQYAVKKGRVKKLPCKYCGDKSSVAHHPDYEKPYNVVWVCKIHHRKIHYGDNSKE